MNQTNTTLAAAQYTQEKKEGEGNTDLIHRNGATLVTLQKSIKFQAKWNSFSSGLLSASNTNLVLDFKNKSILAIQSKSHSIHGIHIAKNQN